VGIGAGTVYFDRGGAPTARAGARELLAEAKGE
jgi:hypothetical protein